jgi:general secretion pathway protein K
MKHVYHSKEKQKGVALFVTLLVVTIASLLATEMWFNNTLDISRTYNNHAAYQGNHYAKGMVLWAQDVLRLDYENTEFDNHSEPWNQTIAGIQVEDALLSGQLTDLDSKFNLNNLIINGIEQDLAIAYFQRILKQLELDPGLLDKILDWLDPDQIPHTQGAEDTIYLSRSPSYRTADQPFIHISELKLIDGINEQTYQRLKSYVTVLPILGNQMTKLNVNTASTLLLMAIDDQIQVKDALNLYEDGNASNRTIADFFRQPAIQYYALKTDELEQILTTNSQWFQAKVNVKMQETTFQKYVLVYRPTSSSVAKQWSDTAFE